MSDNPMTQALELIKQLDPNLYERLTVKSAPPADTSLPLPHPPIYATRPQRRTVRHVTVARNVTRPQNLAHHMLTPATHTPQDIASKGE
jgi:hypothetical protein